MIPAADTIYVVFRHRRQRPPLWSENNSYVVFDTKTLVFGYSVSIVFWLVCQRLI